MDLFFPLIPIVILIFFVFALVLTIFTLTSMRSKGSLKALYLYLMSAIGLAVVTIGSITLVKVTLDSFILPTNNFVFRCEDNFPRPVPVEGTDKNALAVPSEEERQAQIKRCEEDQVRQRTFQRNSAYNTSIAMLVVGVPLFLYHWQLVKRQKEEEPVA
ncbi:MAG: hypothetical protein HY459_04920 [Parcubacteria group bacterium]|nr:hypothetical protein [Parcubacteria group bacterium]